MLIEYVDADAKQHNPAQHLRIKAQRCQCPDAFADLQSDDREQAGHHADTKGRQPDRDIQHGNAEADGQGIYAGGHGKHHQTPPPGGVLARCRSLRV